MEQYANNASSTLNGAINNSVTSITVLDASSFPSSGDFQIRIENEILKVTAVSSNTLTVVRAQEGTSAASHADTTPVLHILTKQSFLNLIRDSIAKGTYSSRPSASREGQLYLATDNPGIIYRDNGSAWEIIPGIDGPFPKPDFTKFGTWVNQQNASYSQVGDFIRFEDDGTNNSGEDLRLRVQSLVGTATATITLGCRYYCNSRAPLVFGVAFRKSGTGAILGLGFIIRDGTALKTFLARWTDYNTFGTTHLEQLLDARTDVIYLRGKWTGSSNFEFYVSKDGTKWMKYHTITDSNLSSFDQLGVFVNYYNPLYTDGSAPVGMDIFYLDHAET